MTSHDRKALVEMVGLLIVVTIVVVYGVGAMLVRLIS